MLAIIQQIDESILFYITEYLHTPFGDWFMPIITSLNDNGFIWIAIAFLLLLRPKTRSCGIILSCALLFEVLLGNGILKPLIERDRPFIRFPDVELLIKKPGGYSFPSGHTMSSFAAATVILHFNKRAGYTAFFLASLIGFSRLYLFCHYPSDVISGAILGSITSLITIKAMMNIGIHLKSVNQP